MKKRKSGRFMLCIYKAKYCFENYDDSIYRVSADKVKPEDVRIIRYADSPEELLEMWKALLEKYEGYTYCVWDELLDERIVGGVFDPSDDEYIKEYFT